MFASDSYYRKTDDELPLFALSANQHGAGPVAASRRGLSHWGGRVASWAGVVAAPLGPAGGRLLLRAAVGMWAVVGFGASACGTDEARYPATVAPVARPKAPPKLIAVPMSAIPSYDGPVAKSVEQQLRRVPAAERAGQPLRQYRELAKRFWAAETQTEYLTQQAHAGQAGPLFAEQAEQVRRTWQAWNQVAVYTYQFGPGMQAHLLHMTQIASSQQNILAQLPGLLANRRFLTDKELTARERDVQDGLAKLLPASPVTGRPYKAIVLKAPM